MGDPGCEGQGRDRGQGEHGGGPPEIYFPQHISRLRGSLVLAKTQVCTSSSRRFPRPKKNATRNFRRILSSTPTSPMEWSVMDCLHTRMDTLGTRWCLPKSD